MIVNRLLIASTFALLPLLGHAESVILLDPKSDFKERILPRAKVSTQIVMGIMMTGSGGDGAPPALAMAVPASWKPKGQDTNPICVRIVSKDGRYAATNAYRLTAGVPAQIVPLEFPTEEVGFLSENEAVARVTIGDCLDPPTLHAPALWEARPPAQILNVYLNTGGQPAAVASDGPGDYAAHCIDEAEAKGLKYTVRCEVPLAHLENGQPTALFFSVKRNRTVERFQIEVVVPSGI